MNLQNKWLLGSIVIISLVVVVTFVTIALLPNNWNTIIIINKKDSCADRCGENYDYIKSCQCNTDCEKNLDCCKDYTLICDSDIETESCVGRCGDAYNATIDCQCNPSCMDGDGNCCFDYYSECVRETSCIGRCNIAYDANLPCQCNDQCVSECCADYVSECAIPIGITDQEIADLSQKIWLADDAKVLVELDPQVEISDYTTEDDAPNKLFKSIPQTVYLRPIYVKLTALFDNYIPDESVAEDITESEWDEVDEFLNVAMTSEALMLTHRFLSSKGVVPKDAAEFKAELKKIWFTLYERSGAISSCGAEHVLVGETKGDLISGLHNWLRFALLEQEEKVNYLGYVKLLSIGPLQTYLIRNPFYWDEYYKPIGTFFIGNSPAFDLAVYTLCFYARPNSGDCTLNIHGNDIKIQTYTMEYKGETLVGSSYPNY